MLKMRRLRRGDDFIQMGTVRGSLWTQLDRAHACRGGCWFSILTSVKRLSYRRSSWLWVKTRPPGDCRFWSLVPVPRAPFWAFWVPIFDPHPDMFCDASKDSDQFQDVSTSKQTSVRLAGYIVFRKGARPTDVSSIPPSNIQSSSVRNVSCQEFVPHFAAHMNIRSSGRTPPSIAIQFQGTYPGFFSSSVTLLGAQSWVRLHKSSALLMVYPKPNHGYFSSAITEVALEALFPRE